MKKTRRLYISGPMKGRPEHNYPAFHALATELRSYGYEVLNPAELELIEPCYHDWHTSLKRDLKYLLDCDGVVVLPEWESSRGARLEVMVATQLDLPILQLKNSTLNTINVGVAVQLDTASTPVE